MADTLDLSGFAEQSKQFETLLKSVNDITESDVPAALKLTQLMNLHSKKQDADGDNIISDKIGVLLKLVQKTASEMLPEVIDKPTFMDPKAERDAAIDAGTYGRPEEKKDLVEMLFPDKVKKYKDMMEQINNPIDKFISGIFGLGN